ncbi:hypothetical protein D9M68_575920 [compost metagenome]
MRGGDAGGHRLRLAPVQVPERVVKFDPGRLVGGQAGIDRLDADHFQAFGIAGVDHQRHAGRQRVAVVQPQPARARRGGLEQALGLRQVFDHVAACQRGACMAAVEAGRQRYQVGRLHHRGGHHVGGRIGWPYAVDLNRRTG